MLSQYKFRQEEMGYRFLKKTKVKHIGIQACYHERVFENQKSLVVIVVVVVLVLVVISGGNDTDVIMFSISLYALQSINKSSV